MPWRRLALAFWLLAASLDAEQVRITVLATTDLHGNLYPVDYFTGRPAPRGLAKLSTLIREQRAANPNHLLLDCGDTIQGTPLEYVYQTWVHAGHFPLNLSFAGRLPGDPMMQAMNQLGYDAMALGNHEFNFGLKNLERARAEARFPWLSANTRGGEKPFPRYLLRTVAGIKVAVIGVTTPAVPTWEKAGNLGGYRFLPPRQAVEETLAELRAERPALVVIAAHAGRGGAVDKSGENPMDEVARSVPGIDAIVLGHTHQSLPQVFVNGVLLAQPKNWGMSLARLDFVLESLAGGWKVVEKSSRLIPVADATPADPEILALAKPYHDLTERYLNTEVARSAAELDAKLGRVEDTALVDAVHQVQLHYAQADVSFTALFNPRVRVPRGPVTVRQIAALYLYENELYAIEGDGQMVKEALENAARYFLSCRDAACAGPLINSAVFGFNYEMAQGVEYEIDLTRPEGDRVRNLRWRGRPLDPRRKLRIAINNYRAGGSAGYSMFRDARVVWRSPEDIRQLIIQYYSQRGSLPAQPDGNWRIVPETARRTLAQQALADAERASAF